jgi:hypothetical protein
MGFREWLAKRAAQHRNLRIGLVRDMNVSGLDFAADAIDAVDANIAYYSSAAEAFEEYRSSEVFGAERGLAVPVPSS